jgi:metal-responsive CopG/Arc/MetJ family transcriptional regulator
MKVRTSITLSRGLLDDIDRLAEEFGSRSELVEHALRAYVDRRAREARDRRDRVILDARADALNAEAEDALDYQLEP